MEPNKVLSEARTTTTGRKLLHGLFVALGVYLCVAWIPPIIRFGHENPEKLEFPPTPYFVWSFFTGFIFIGIFVILKQVDFSARQITELRKELLELKRSKDAGTPPS